MGEVVKNVTNAAKSAISLGIATKAATVVEEVATEAATEAAMVVVVEGLVGVEEAPWVGRLATHVEAMGTCPEIAPRARNATTVSWVDIRVHIIQADKLRRGGRTSLARLPFRDDVGANVLQVQAAWSRSGILPQLKPTTTPFPPPTRSNEGIAWRPDEIS